MMGDEESDAAGEFMLVYDGFDPSLGKGTGSSSGLLSQPGFPVRSFDPAFRVVWFCLVMRAGSCS
jgi:hypothetical protein